MLKKNEKIVEYQDLARETKNGMSLQKSYQLLLVH